MSESKTRLTTEVIGLKADKHELTLKLVRLLAYVLNMQDDNPDLDWPQLPDAYPDLVWRYAA